MSDIKSNLRDFDKLITTTRESIQFLPMTEQEVKDFLSNSKLNIRLRTLDEKGLPNIHPAWYYFDSSSSRLDVNTARN
jgi:hypothetical protein